MLSVTAVAVQVVFADRADWVSHVLAGGAIVLMIGALGRRVLGVWSTTLAALIALAAAVAVEVTVSGPFDPSDAAFTLAGATLITGGTPDGPGSLDTRRQRRARLGWGGAVFAFAVFYRYGIQRGP